jgi:hypothetical protein
MIPLSHRPTNKYLMPATPSAARYIHVSKAFRLEEVGDTKKLVWYKGSTYRANKNLNKRLRKAQSEKRLCQK